MNKDAIMQNTYTKTIDLFFIVAFNNKRIFLLYFIQTPEIKYKVGDFMGCD